MKNKKDNANKEKQLLIPFIYAKCEHNPTGKWLHEWTEDKNEPSGNNEAVIYVRVSIDEQK